MTTKLSAKQQHRLNEFHKEFDDANKRMQMAIQTLQGAQQDMASKRVRFESTVEFLGGAGATWAIAEDGNVTVAEKGAEPPTPEIEAQNGAGTSHRYNHETRRAAKKALGK